MPDEPAHHRRYRVAWQSYIDPDTPEDCKLDLEKEMDDAHHHFELDEFQTFKRTLHGFVKHWKQMEDGISKFRKK